MHYLTKNIDTHQIQAGDGSSLCIIHIGIASLSIFLKSFVFDNILAMLQITKNLISIQKLAHDNNVYFNFHDTYFFIKDYSRNISIKAIPKTCRIILCSLSNNLLIMHLLVFIFKFLIGIPNWDLYRFALSTKHWTQIRFL
jgi:hypothetical protein